MLNKVSVFILFGLSVLISCTNNSNSKQNSYAVEDEVQSIKEILHTQQLAWNSFDIPTFMEAYWNSPEMTFVSKNGVVYGWKGMKERYEKNYPDQAAMGHLEFVLKEVKLTSSTTALVIGSWDLTRPEVGDVGGFFTLTLQKIDGKWKIINDHTS